MKPPGPPKITPRVRTAPPRRRSVPVKPESAAGALLPATAFSVNPDDSVRIVG